MSVDTLMRALTRELGSRWVNDTEINQSRARGKENRIEVTERAIRAPSLVMREKK